MKRSGEEETHPEKRELDIAVALRYRKDENFAPRVVAGGRGIVAKKILEKAQEHGVPIQEQPEAARILADLEIGEEIPAELYRVIAEVLAFVYSVEKKST